MEQREGEKEKLRGRKELIYNGQKLKEGKRTMSKFRMAAGGEIHRLVNNNNHPPLREHVHPSPGAGLDHLH